MKQASYQNFALWYSRDSNSEKLYNLIFFWLLSVDLNFLNKILLYYSTLCLSEEFAIICQFFLYHIQNLLRNDILLQSVSYVSSTLSIEFTNYVWFLQHQVICIYMSLCRYNLLC